MNGDFDNRAIVTEDGSRYLEVCNRIDDARKDGCTLLTALVKHDPQIAVFKASVMKGGKMIAEAYGSRQSKFEVYYLEHAETAAIGRALSDAGYNIYSYELSDNMYDHTIVLDDGEDYLTVPYRVAMFRKAHPFAVIIKTLLSGPENGSATMRVEIKEGDQILAVAHAQRNYADDEKKRNFVECAETAAVGRALSILGFDLPPGRGNHFSDGADVADAPVGKSEVQTKVEEKKQTSENIQKPSESKAKSSEKDESRKAEPKKNAVKAEVPKSDEPPVQRAPEPEEERADAVDDIPEDIEIPDEDYPETYDYYEQEPVDTEPEPEPEITPEPVTKQEEEPAKESADPMLFIIPSGINKGKKMSDMWENNWEWVRLVAYDARVAKKAEPELIKAAKTICEKNGIKTLDDNPKDISPESFVIPSGKHKGKKMGDMWGEDWKWVRMVAYDPRIAQKAEPELVQNAQALCQSFGIKAIDEGPGGAKRLADTELKPKETKPDINPAIYVIPSGKHKGTTIGDMWRADYQYVRMLAYEPKVAKYAEPELIANAKAMCLQFGVKDLNSEYRPDEPDYGNSRLDEDFMRQLEEEGKKSFEELENDLFGTPAEPRSNASATDVAVAGKMEIDLGMKHKGETIEAVYQSDPKYIQWLAGKSNAKDELKQAAAVYLAAQK